jgi:hypothetical protein
VLAWGVLGERPVESRFDIREGRLTPLIGRELEMELLVERFERAVGGEGQVVLLSGEAGIGKIGRDSERGDDLLAKQSGRRALL